MAFTHWEGAGQLELQPSDSAREEEGGWPLPSRRVQRVGWRVAELHTGTCSDLGLWCGQYCSSLNLARK